MSRIQDLKLFANLDETRQSWWPHDLPPWSSQTVCYPVVPVWTADCFSSLTGPGTFYRPWARAVQLVVGQFSSLCHTHNHVFPRAPLSWAGLNACIGPPSWYKYLAGLEHDDCRCTALDGPGPWNFPRRRNASDPATKVHNY